VRLNAAVFLLLTAGCAAPAVETTAPQNTYQHISIRTPGVDKANCFVAFGGASIPVETPALLRVPRGQQPLDISCFKGPHVSGHAVVAAQFAASEKGVADCKSCNYPEDILVPMTIRAESVR
jgi:hypothetical protein